jgi:hypothetical protein
MTKNYDPQYSTQVAFNIPIMKAMLEKHDINLVKHWFENGEPNKNLASAALQEFFYSNWIEALNLLWDLGWLTKKAFISKAWDAIACGHGRSHAAPLKNTLAEEWLINKTFNEKNLSANEINNLRLKVLDMNNISRNEYYWDMFFVDDLKIKGKLSESIFHGVMYYSYYEHENNHQSPVPKELMFKRMNQIIEHKNGFEIPYYYVLKILLVHKDVDLFWKIMNSKLIMSKQDLFVLAGLLSIYFNVTGKLILKQTDAEIDANIEKMTRCLVKCGLQESVDFNAEDISDKYSLIFANGYLCLSKTNMFNSTLSGETTAAHLPRVPTDYFKDAGVTVTLHSGDAIFAKLTVNGFKTRYKELTTEQQKEYRDKFATYLK